MSDTTLWSILTIGVPILGPVVVAFLFFGYNKEKWAKIWEGYHDGSLYWVAVTFGIALLGEFSKLTPSGIYSADALTGYKFTVWVALLWSLAGLTTSKKEWPVLTSLPISFALSLILGIAYMNVHRLVN